MIQQKKIGFFKKNKEKLKKGFNIGSHVASILSVIILAGLHVINPAVAIVSVPAGFGMLISAFSRISPATLTDIKKEVIRILPNHDENEINSFVDDVSNFSKMNTSRSLKLPNDKNEPYNHQVTTPTEYEIYNAYRNKKTGAVELTPRMEIKNNKK